MQLNISGLTGYKIKALDGEIGKVEEFYFNDLSWMIRYLIVKTGNWLSERKVLISPQAFLPTSWTQGEFPVNLTKEKILTSPDIDTDKPVSRQQEIELYGHYAWQSYWGSGFFAGGFANVPDSDIIIDEKTTTPTGTWHGNPHLRSTHRVIGYNIEASDGSIGHISDLIFDDQTWQIVYLVIETHRWFGGKRVLVTVWHVKEIQWENVRVVLKMDLNAVKNSPLYDPGRFRRVKF